MASFETRDLSVGNIFENTTALNELHAKMMKRRSYYQPNPEEFIGKPGYDESNIRAELQKIEQRKKEWAAASTPETDRQKMISDIIEGIIVDQFSGSWLSEKAHGHYTSEADDVLRGVDVIAELDREDGSHYLGFAIDVTMAKDPSVLDAKLERNWKDVETGRFPDVKYFEDDDGNKQHVSPLRVLIAVNPSFAKDLMSRERKNDKDGLANHVFQAHLILQIKEQLESYYHYAQLTRNERLMDKIADSLRVFYEVITQDKEEFLVDHAKEVESEVDFIRIHEYCQTKLRYLQEAA